MEKVIEKVQINGDIKPVGGTHFDAPWVFKYAALRGGSVNGNVTETFSLADYLPADSYSYEVLLDGEAYCTSTGGTVVDYVMNSEQGVIGIVRGNNSNGRSDHNSIVIVDDSRTVTGENLDSGTGKVQIYLRAYRRLGEY